MGLRPALGVVVTRWLWAGVKNVDEDEDEDEDEDGEGMSMWIGGHESRQICAARESVRERR
jgi:hypothetical protein